MVCATDTGGFLVEPRYELFNQRSLFEPLVSGALFDQFMKSWLQFFWVISEAPEPFADQDIDSSPIVLHIFFCTVISISSDKPLAASVIIDIVALYLPPLPVVVGAFTSFAP